MRLKFTCKPRKGLGLFTSLFASQLSFQLSTLSSLVHTGPYLSLTMRVIVAQRVEHLLQKYFLLQKMWVEELRKIVNVAGLSLCFPPSYCENFKRQHPENNDKFPRTQKYSKIMNIQIVIRSRKNLSDFFFSIGKEWSKNWQRNTVA